MPEDLTPASETLVKSTTTPRAGYTPGPWTAHYSWECEQRSCPDPEYPRWCEVTGPDRFSVTGLIGIDNARLIAAAPELLAALKRVLTDCEIYDGVSVTQANYPEAYAALAKAEGR